MPLPNYIKIFIEVQKKIKQAASQIMDGHNNEAEKYLIDAMRLCPQSANAMYLYSYCLKEKGEANKSQYFKRAAFKLNPCFYTTLGDEVLRVAKQIVTNFKDMTGFVKKSEEGIELKWAELVGAFSKKKDLDTSLQVMVLFQKVKISQQKYTTHLHSTFGITYYEMGMYEISLEKYRIAIEIGTDQFRYMNNSAILTYIFGQYERSEQFARQSLQIKPNYAKTMFIQSFNLAKMGRIEESMQKILAAINDSPKLTLYRLKIVTNLIQYQPHKLGQIKQELKLIIRILQNKQDSDSYFNNDDNRPLLKQALQFMDRHVEHYSKVDDENWREYVQLMDDYLMKGHLDKYKITQQMRSIKHRMQVLLKQVAEQVNHNYLPDQLLLKMHNQQPPLVYQQP